MPKPLNEIVRYAIAQDLDYDIERIGGAMQERQSKNERSLVRLLSKRIPEPVTYCS